jgi:hypothetical protein
MPLSDFPRTSAAQAAQVPFNLSEDQFLGAIDGGIKAVNGDTTSSAYWGSTVNIPLLESFISPFTLEDVCAALQAGRSSADPEAMRGIRYNAPVGMVKYVQLNIDAVEAQLSGFGAHPLEALRGFIALAT